MKNKNVFRMIEEITLNKKNKFTKLAESSQPNMENPNPAVFTKKPPEEIKEDVYSSMQKLTAQYPSIYSNLRVIARKATEEFYLHWQQAILQGTGEIYTLLREYFMDIYARRKQLEDYANKEYNERLRAFRMIRLSKGGESQPFIAMDGNAKQLLNALLSGAAVTSTGMELGEATNLTGIAGGGQLVGGPTTVSQIQLLLGSGGTSFFDVETTASMLLKIDQSLKTDKPERNKYGIQLLDKMFDMWLNSFWAIYDEEFGILAMQEMTGVEQLGEIGPSGFKNPDPNFMKRINKENDYPIMDGMSQFDINKGTNEEQVESTTYPHPKNPTITPQNIVGKPESLKKQIRQMLDIKSGGYDKWVNDHLYIPSMQERAHGATQLIQDGLAIIGTHESKANFNIATIGGQGLGGFLDRILPQRIIDAIASVFEGQRS
jgi:hypothetical protein